MLRIVVGLPNLCKWKCLVFLHSKLHEVIQYVKIQHLQVKLLKGKVMVTIVFLKVKDANVRSGFVKLEIMYTENSIGVAPK